MNSPLLIALRRFAFVRRGPVPLVVLLVSLCSTPAFGQSAAIGSLTGRVINEATGEYLRNAIIAVPGTPIAAVAGAGGYYALNDLPAGATKLIVTYAGLEPQEALVTITAGQAVTRDFSLTDKSYSNMVKLDQYVVSTSREGNARAIMDQRTAVNPKKVISADALGSVSEGNVGEFLKLMPGVNMDYTEADARRVRVRGLDPKYANVTFDGMQVANAGSSDVNTGRRFEFEQLSIASIETVELTKAPTADQPSSVAGTVNLKSKGAFDRRGRRISFNAALSANSYYLETGKTYGWDNQDHYKLLPNVSLEFSDVFLNGKLGVITGFSLSNTIAAQKHVWFFNNLFNADLTDNATEIPVVRQVFYQDGPKPTSRGNYNVRLDYKFHEGFSIYGRVDFTTYDARFYNRTLNLRPTTTAPGATATDQTVTDGRISTDSNQFMTKAGDTLMLTSGGTYQIGNFTVEAGLHYSRAKNWYENLENGHFTDYSSSLNNVSWRMTRPSPGSTDLTFTQLSGPDWRNIANYTFDTYAPRLFGFYAPMGWHERRSKDQQWTARVDFKNTFATARVPQILKYGVMTNLKVLDVFRAGQQNINPTGPNGIMGDADDLRPSDFVDPRFSSDFGVGGNLNGWMALSPWKLYDRFRSNPNDFREDPDNALRRARGSFDFKEKIDALYVSDTIKAGKLEVTPGLRYEATESSGKGTNNVAGNAPVTGGNDYNATLKYLHSSFKFHPNLIARASYHEAITRADTANLIPGIASINQTAAEITASNPDLKMERSKTYNLGLEYYFEPVGVISATIFQSKVRDRQFTNQRIRLDATGFEGDATYANWTLISSANVPTPTKYSGLELDYSQQLSFLPGVFRGLGVFANHTRLKYDEWEFYTNAPKSTTNGGVSFSYGRFSSRVNFNWVGKLLTVPGRSYNVATGVWTSTATGVRTFQKDRLVTDLNLEFKLTNALTVFVDGRNILNEPSQYTYYEREDNFERVLRTGGIWMFGVKGRF